MFNFALLKNAVFASVAQQHWKGLQGVQRNVGGRLSYYAWSIKKRTDEKALGNGKNNIFFKDLKAEKYKLLRKIIMGNTTELSEIVDQIEKKISLGRYPKMWLIGKNGKPALTPFGKLVEYVFDYNSFISDRSGWNAYDLTNKMAIDVCTYCNRNYTYTIFDEKGKRVARPELDHFLLKSKYPYLALSFYNLIPSCHTCNSGIKGSKDFNFRDYIHPYRDCLDDLIQISVRFKEDNHLSPDERKRVFGLAFFNGQIDSFDLVFNHRNATPGKEQAKANASVKAFQLELLYNCHKDLVVDMIVNAIIYNESYIESLLNSYSPLFRNRDDVIRHITKNLSQPEAMYKRPFSKLSRDIHREFGLNY